MASTVWVGADTAGEHTPDRTRVPRVIFMTLVPTGTLRASINLGNPVLAQGTPEEPRGITVELARELAARLGVPLELLCFTAARDSFAALVDERADVGFLAIEPAREAEVAFTAPYVVIEGVYVVPADSPVATAADVDRPGTRIGVKRGTAYDLYLTRTLEHAELVRGDEGLDVYLSDGLEVGRRRPAAGHGLGGASIRGSGWWSHGSWRSARRWRRPIATPSTALAAFVDDVIATRLGGRAGSPAARTRLVLELLVVPLVGRLALLQQLPGLEVAGGLRVVEPLGQRVVLARLQVLGQVLVLDAVPAVVLVLVESRSRLGVRQ